MSNVADHLDGNMKEEDALHRIKTAGSITISPELFEKIYLSPQNVVKGELRKTLANPTPLALVGFLLSLTPLCMDLMNFRGTQSGSGSTNIGAYYFYGATLMILGALGEFLLGNTFPFVVFGSFGAFWGFFGSFLNPQTGAISNYTPYALTKGNALTAPPLLNSLGLFLIWMGVLCLVYLVLSLRTNLVFFLIFLCLVPAFAFLAGAFFYAAKGDANTYTKYLKVGGALAFVVCLLGWWIFMAIMLACLDFPFQLPVGDLSHIIKGASERV